MFGPKIKVSKTLYDKLREASLALGCSSVDEFAVKVLDSESSRVLSKSVKSAGASESEIAELKNKLKGLGYLD